MPRVPSHGFAPTLQEAKTAFATHRRRWLALQYPVDRVSARRQTGSGTCVIDSREPGWFFARQPLASGTGLDPEHVGTVLGAFFGEEGGAAKGGTSDTAPIRMGMPRPCGITSHRLLDAPAVDDRDASALRWRENGSDVAGLHLNLDRRVTIGRDHGCTGAIVGPRRSTRWRGSKT
jgi:hypothetical protein